MNPIYAADPMKLSIPIAAGLLAVVLSSCRESPEIPPPSNEEIRSVTELGERAAESLMTSLGGQLKAALEAGGPVDAMRICREAAGPLTSAADASFQEGSVRRTALRVRNPGNAPDELDRKILVKLAAADDPPPAQIEWTLEIARFYKPLVTQEICLNCHGDPETFSPELGGALADLYPDDRATGYRTGDLRGVIRVDIPRQ